MLVYFASLAYYFLSDAAALPLTTGKTLKQFKVQIQFGVKTF
jgi:hypothetical protein